MNGNFKAEHMRLRNPTDELWLMDGRGFMVASGNYRDYLAGTANQPEVSAESTSMIITNLQHHQENGGMMICLDKPDKMIQT